MFLALLALLAAAAERRPTLVTYQVSERASVTTPAGEHNAGLLGTVRVAGERARLELSGGTFPRSTADVALAGKSDVVLLDRKEKIAASASLGDFEALFLGAASTERGASAFAYRDVTAEVTKEGAGAPFQDLPTVRYRVRVSFELAGSTPARVTRVRTTLVAVVETLPGADDARSAFDDLSRLFPVREDAREALVKELAKITGLPVSATVNVTSEVSTELIGPSAASPEGPPRDAKTTATFSRSLTNLRRRSLGAEDAALFEPPSEYKLRGLERVLTDGARLR